VTQDVRVTTAQADEVAGSGERSNEPAGSTKSYTFLQELSNYEKDFLSI
jgi:hypothetical protein